MIPTLANVSEIRFGTWFLGFLERIRIPVPTEREDPLLALKMRKPLG